MFWSRSTSFGPGAALVLSTGRCCRLNLLALRDEASPAFALQHGVQVFLDGHLLAVAAVVVGENGVRVAFGGQLSVHQLTAADTQRGSSDRTGSQEGRHVRPRGGTKMSVHACGRQSAETEPQTDQSEAAQRRGAPADRKFTLSSFRIKPAHEETGESA